MASQLASALASSIERVILKLFFERFYKETTSLKEVRGLRSGLHHRGKCNLCEKEVDQFEAYTQFRIQVAFFSKTLVPVSVFHRKESPLRWKAVKIDIVKVFCFWFMDSNLWYGLLWDRIWNYGLSNGIYLLFDIYQYLRSIFGG